MLSDESNRQIYDVYGMEGLNAGMDLGAKFSSQEEVRQEWERFREKMVSQLTGGQTL